MRRIRDWFGRHPLVANWLLLSIGMVAILLWAATDTPFTSGQRAALIVATILVAGLCARIIGWAD
jgi:hypothetical protein